MSFCTNCDEIYVWRDLPHPREGANADAPPRTAAIRGVCAEDVFCWNMSSWTGRKAQVHLRRGKVPAFFVSGVVPGGFGIFAGENSVLERGAVLPFAAPYAVTALRGRPAFGRSARRALTPSGVTSVSRPFRWPSSSPLDGICETRARDTPSISAASLVAAERNAVWAGFDARE